MTLAGRVLLGLVAGFALGLALPGGSGTAVLIGALTPVGTVFGNLIRMTAIPLIASMLVASLGRMQTSRVVARATIRAVALAVALIVIAATASIFIARPVLARVQIDRTAAMALRGPTPPVTAAAPTLAAWLTDLVPGNVIKAAADGAIVPVIVFAALFGLALARVRPDRRDAVLGVVDGLADTMLRLVGWILSVAPIGVFALAVPLASRLGLSAAGAVIAYIVLVVVLTVAATLLLLYPLGILAGPLSASGFVAACAAPQSIAFAARSSLAAIPAMIDSADRAGITSDSARFLLPLAASLFHFGAGVAQTVGALFIARLYGVELTSAQLVIVVVTVVMASFATPGVPGGSIIAMVPVLAAVQLPLEGIAILLAVDTIPDMFRTTANTTGAMTVTIVAPGRS